MTNSPILCPQVSWGARAPLPVEHLIEFYASIPTPVTVVGAFNSEMQPTGTTVGSYCTVSLVPPLASFCLLPSSDLLASLAIGKDVTVHFPRNERAHIDLAKRFAGKGGPAKFENVNWRSVNGAPVIDHIPSASACVTMISDGGDHRIITVQLSTVPEPLVRPLLYRQRSFGTFNSEEVLP